MVLESVDAKMVAGQRFAARIVKWPAVAFLAAASSFYSLNYTRSWWNSITERLGLTVNALDGSDFFENENKHPWWKRLLGGNNHEKDLKLPVDIMNEFLKKDEFSKQLCNGRVARFDTNQYSANNPIEDRHVECHFPSSNAIVFGVFDGHGGYHCSESLRRRIPYYLSPALSRAANDGSEVFEKSNHISILGMEHLNNPDLDLPNDFTKKQALLETGSNEFSKYLDSISTKLTTQDALRLAFKTLDEDICKEAVPNGVADNSLLVGLAGSCAVVSVIQGDDLYVANTGDCRAVIGRRSTNDAWVASQVTQDQTVENLSEIHRIEEEHPNEKSTAIQRGRLLGQLQPLRSFGDIQYKWNRDLHAQVLNIVYGRPVVPPNSYLTPPYLTAEPIVYYRKITDEDKFMIIATDGLWEKVSSEMAVKLIGSHLDYILEDPQKEQSGFVAENGSTLLIKFALGKGNNSTLANMLTLPEEYKRHFHDDITVTVVYFDSTFVKSKL